MTLNLASITVEKLLEFTSKELQEFQLKLSFAIEQRLEEDKIAFQNEVQELASKRGFSLDTKRGFSLDTLLGTQSKKTKAAEYRNPDNLKQVWAGHGRKPNWLLEFLSAGRKLEEFKV